jgi:hypothetical protein
MFINDALVEHWTDLGNKALSAPPTLVSFTMTSGQSLSAAAAVPSGMRPVALLLPSNWTGSLISIQASFDNFSTFYEVTDNYNAATQFQPSQIASLMYAQMYGAPFLKIRSGSLNSPAAQSGGDRALQMVCYNCNALA